MRTRPSFALACLLFSGSIASAQALELPQPSPHARTEQRVGITDVSIDYSSPGVKGRKVWGEVVPYDKAWRAGANAPTKLTASRDFKIAGTLIKAGTYSVFITPSKTAAWTVAFNTDLTASQEAYDAKKDVAKLTVKPAALAAPRERLLWYFTDTQDTKTSLDLEWEKIRIRVPIEIDTPALVNAAIEKATNDAWRPHFQSAGYLFDSGGDVNRALAMVDKSIAIQSTWRNEWLRAQILWKKGQKAEARAEAEKAQTMGKGDQAYESFGKDQITKAMAGWK
jgi:hypothetical protein